MNQSRRATKDGQLIVGYEQYQQQNTNTRKVTVGNAQRRQNPNVRLEQQQVNPGSHMQDNST